MMLVAFDSLASDKADLERLFRLLTTRIAFLTAGGPAPDTPNPRLPPMDSGILGPFIAPDNLTITVSLGESLFDARYGLAKQKPKALQKMTRFPNDSLTRRCVMATCFCRFVPIPGHGDPRPARYHQAHAGSSERALEAGRFYLGPRRPQ